MSSTTPPTRKPKQVRSPIRYAPPIANGDQAMAAPKAARPNTGRAVSAGTTLKPSSVFEITYAMAITMVATK